MSQIDLTLLSSLPQLVRTELCTKLVTTYWITSAEEFLDVARAENSVHGNGLGALAAALDQDYNKLQVLRDQLAEAIERRHGLPFAGPLTALEVGFGYREDEDDVPEQELPFSPIMVDLAPEAYLKPPRPDPPPNQGKLATCVAFTLAAMAEYTLGEGVDLSEQFLFWAAQQRDEGASLAKGILIKAGITALHEAGICPEELWPYRSDLNDSSWQHGPGNDAQMVARERRIKPNGMGWRYLANHTNPNSIALELQQGRPVLLALPISPYWYASWQGQKLGRIRLPLPGEESPSLPIHTVCAVGYRFDQAGELGTPGGGYLIVRNSWGADWGAANPTGAGFGYLPFALLKANRRAGVIEAFIERSLQPKATDSTHPGVEVPVVANPEGALRATLTRLTQLHSELNAGLIALEGEIAQLHTLLAVRAAAHNPAPNLAPLVQIASPDRDTSPLLIPNGIDVTTGQPSLVLDAEYVRTKLLAGQAKSSERKRGDEKQPTLGLSDRFSYGPLAQAGWALVVSSEDDTEIIERLVPLIRQRSEQQGIPLPELTFIKGERCGAWLQRHGANPNQPLLGEVRLPVLLYQPNETCSQWLARHGVMARAVDPSLGVPFYLLIAARPGPLHPEDKSFIPFEFQYELDLFWGVGRICFSDGHGKHRYPAYERYANHVVACETDPPSYERRIDYLATQHELDRATALSMQELIEPLFGGKGDGQTSVAAQRGFTARLLRDAEAHRDAVVATLAGRTSAGRPAILFAAVHGAEFPVTDARHAAHQGALICQDWSGIGAVTRTQWLAAEDISDEVDLRGLIVLSLSCFGVGCPALDQFVLDQTRPLAPYPMVAQLPQRLLERGALAVLGHVDRAWTYAFRSADGRVTVQTQGFEDVLSRLMQGYRMGHVTDQFNQIQASYAVQLADFTRRYQERNPLAVSPEALPDLGRTWAAYQDARCYVLFGDPAVHLPGVPAAAYLDPAST